MVRYLCSHSRSTHRAVAVAAAAVEHKKLEKAETGGSLEASRSTLDYKHRPRLMEQKYMYTPLDAGRKESLSLVNRSCNTRVVKSKPRMKFYNISLLLKTA
jgi:hypothetical protein